jgi:hypothetical protein
MSIRRGEELQIYWKQHHAQKEILYIALFVAENCCSKVKIIFKKDVNVRSISLSAIYYISLEMRFR